MLLGAWVQRVQRLPKLVIRHSPSRKPQLRDVLKGRSAEANASQDPRPTLKTNPR